MQQQFQVIGMACMRCTEAVRDAVSALPDIEHVQADLATGIITLTANVAIPARLVKLAVEEAGYQLAQ